MSARRPGLASTWLVPSVGRRVGSAGCITDRHPCPQEMVITNLQPETAYSITVAAYTMKGDGARSKPKVVVTKGAGTGPSQTPCPQSALAEFLRPRCWGGRRGAPGGRSRVKYGRCSRGHSDSACSSPIQLRPYGNLQHPTLFGFLNVFIWLDWVVFAACELLVAAHELLHAACGM